MRYRSLLPLLALCLSVTCASTVQATDHIYLLVSPNAQINAGFGELTPGPHDLSVTYQWSGGGSPNGCVVGSLFGGSGSTINCWGVWNRLSRSFSISRATRAASACETFGLRLLTSGAGSSWCWISFCKTVPSGNGGRPTSAWNIVQPNE